MGLWACGLFEICEIKKRGNNSNFFKMSYLSMGYSNIMGFSVTMGDLMYLWPVG